MKVESIANALRSRWSQPLLCLHLCLMTHAGSPPSPYSLWVFHPHTLICAAGWIASPPLHQPSSSVSLLEFPAARQSLFLQVIAQGILIKAKICCWEVTFQTSCDFRCEINWANSPVGDKHQGTDAGCFKENAPLSDPRPLQVSFHIWWIRKWRLTSSASQTALTEVINGSSQENHVRARYNPDGHHRYWAIRGAPQHNLSLVWKGRDQCRFSGQHPKPGGLASVNPGCTSVHTHQEMDAVTTEALSSQGKYRFIRCREVGYYRFNELERLGASLRLILISPCHLINHVIMVKHGFHRAPNIESVKLLLVY